MTATDLPPGATLIDDDLPPGATLIPDVAPPVDGIRTTPVVSTAEDADRIYIDKSPMGRVMDAFGQGAKHAWGERPLGLTPEADKALRDIGVFADAEKDNRSFFRSINQDLIRPAAYAIDTLIRGGGAIVTGVAAATGQIAEEIGLVDETGKRRLTRDMLELVNATGTVTAVMPMLPTRAGNARMKAKVERMAEETPASRKAVLEAAERDAPVAASETFPIEPAKAGNIRLDKLNAPEEVERVIADTATTLQTTGQYDEATRGVRTWEATREAAAAIGMKAEDLAKSSAGKAYNAEELLAIRDVLVQSATELNDLRKKALTGDRADVEAFAEAALRHQMIQEKFHGGVAEAGRALNILRSTRGGEAGQAADVIKLFEQVNAKGGSIGDVMNLLGAADTPEKLSKALRMTRNPTWTEKATELFMGLTLSGPRTHMVNITSNAAFHAMSLAEDTIAYGMGVGRRAFGSDAERMSGAELRGRWYGYLVGSKEGTLAAIEALRTGEARGGLSKIETTRPDAIGGVAGKVVRVPLKALMVEDEFFKGWIARQELHSLAARQASREGLKGEAFAQRVADLVENPTDTIRKAVDDKTVELTFQKPLGKLGRSIQDFSNSNIISKIIIPFPRTMININKQAFERTPLAPVMQEVRDNLSGRNGAIERDRQLSRLAMGSAISGVIYEGVAQGVVTGAGPVDPRQKAVDYLNGKAPFSFLKDGIYYEYNRLDPMATVAGITATAVEIIKRYNDVATPEELDKFGHLIFASIGQTMLSKTFASGPADFLKAVTDPERYGERYLNKLAGIVVPTGVAQLAQYDDVYLRDAKTILETWQTRIPGVSQNVLPRRDIWGEPIKDREYLGPELLSPVAIRRVNEDPVNQELLRLKIWPARVQDRIGEVELTVDQYDKLQMISGRTTKQRLDMLVRMPWWFRLSDESRKEIVVNTIQQTRDVARDVYLLRSPDVAEKVMRKRMEQFQRMSLPPGATLLPGR